MASVTVKISNAQDHTPHAALLADEVALEVLLDALNDLDPARTVASPTRIAALAKDIRRARWVLQRKRKAKEVGKES